MEARRRRVVGSIKGRRLSVTECAKRYQVDPRSIRRWLRAYDESGYEGLKSKRKPGRIPRLKKAERILLFKHLMAGPRANGYVVATDWEQRHINGLAKRLFGGPRNVGEVPLRVMYSSFAYPGWLCSISEHVRPGLPKPPPIRKRWSGPYGFGPPKASRMEDLVRLEHALDRRYLTAVILVESGLHQTIQAVTLLARGYPPKVVALQTEQTRREVLRQYRRFVNTGLIRARNQVEITSATARRLIVSWRIRGMAIAKIAKMSDVKHVASSGMVTKFLRNLDMSRRGCTCSKSKILGWDGFDSATLDRLCTLLETSPHSQCLVDCLPED